MKKDKVISFNEPMIGLLCQILVVGCLVILIKNIRVRG